MKFFSFLVGLLLSVVWSPGAPVAVRVPVETARRGIVVAGHPQAAAAGLAVLKAGGNAVDAAVATSLALGVAEPYASGLGGKLMLLYFDAATGRTQAIDALDAGGAFLTENYLRLRPEAHDYGYSSVCVPGLPAGLWLAHQKWGRRPWADDVQPAIALARAGYEILPKTREQFASEERRLRGHAELKKLFLPGGELPVVGTRLKNEDLAQSLELFARGGHDAFYRGALMEKIVTAVQRRGGFLSPQAFGRYEAKLVEPIGIDFLGRRVLSVPPASDGAPLLLTVLKAFERERFAGAPLRRPDNLDRVGRVWRAVETRVRATTGDVAGARAAFEAMVSPAGIAEIRREAFGGPLTAKAEARASEPVDPAVPEWAASTTHFIVVDGAGNVVCATQSLGVHFGAGVAVPGTGIVLNNSMSNFDYTTPDAPDAPAAGKRPTSTISPTLVLKNGRPEIALGAPGSTRIPSALLQVLLDRLVLDRPLRDAIGDARVHFGSPGERGGALAIETEDSFSPDDLRILQGMGWQVEISETAGSGRRFGGVNAVEISPRGKLTGFADPRRTNAAAGY